MTDPENNTIGDPNGIDGLVSVLDVISGDVNNDGEIGIIDALLVAQYYVGLNPGGFESAAADVTANDTNIDIIDALYIAKYYVGLIYSLPGAASAETISLADMANNTKKYIGQIHAKFTLIEIVPANKTYWDYPDGLDIYTLTIRDSLDNEDTVDILVEEYEQYLSLLGQSTVFRIEGATEPLGEADSRVDMHVFAPYIDWNAFVAWRLRAW